MASWPLAARAIIIVWKLSWTRARASDSVLSTWIISEFVCLRIPIDMASISAQIVRLEPW